MNASRISLMPIVPREIGAASTMRSPSFERPLGGRNPWRTRVDLDRLTQSAGERLERDLDDVVQVLPLVQVHVQVRASAPGEGLEEHLRELHVELAELRLGERNLPHEVRATREIEGGRDQRFVHRERRPPVATDAGAITERLEHG